jgi:hypothetical protein
VLLQSAYPLLQETRLQLPPPQEAAAFGRLQAVPHAPQFWAVLSGVSQPLLLVVSLSQSP